MKKRGFLFVLLAIILLSTVVYAECPPDCGSTEKEKTGTPAGSTVDVGTSKVKDTSGGGTADGGVYTTQSGTAIDTSGFPAGTTFEVRGSDVYVNNQKISGAKTIKYEGGQIITDGAKTVIADGSQDIIATDVGTFQAGSVVITNGVNVKYINGCLSADSADSLVESDTIATKLDSMNYCDKTIEVKKADSVWASCVYMEGVENSKITAKTDVTIEADKGSEFTVKDCATNTYDFTSLSDDSSLVVSKSTTNTVLDLKDVQIDLTKDNVRESVQTNETAVVDVSRVSGIQHIHMLPVTLYTYDAKDPSRNFAVRAWQDEHDLYLKKEMTDVLPPDVKDCTACSIMDLANHQYEIRGIIDFNKVQLGVSKNPELFFATANKNAKAILSFDKDNAFINDVLILNDAPPYKTVISNYLTVEEAIQVGNATQRLLSINEKLTKPELSASLIKNYRTAYNPASMKIDSNELNYQRNGVVVNVLPDGSPKIQELLKRIKNSRTVLFLGGMPLLGLCVFFKKRGQLSIFLIIGLIILMMMGALLFLAGKIGGLNGIQATSQEAVQDYVTGCLKQSGTQSLRAWALQGGHLALQKPFFSDPPTAYDYDRGSNNLLPLDRIELDLGEDTKNRVNVCLNDFKDIRGGTVEIIGSPTVTAILGKDATTFTLDYHFFLNKPDTRWEFTKFAATVPQDALTFLSAANSTVESQIWHENKINLDSLNKPVLTFFPKDKTLMTAIENPNQDFLFFFANNR